MAVRILSIIDLNSGMLSLHFQLLDILGALCKISSHTVHMHVFLKGSFCQLSDHIWRWLSNFREDFLSLARVNV